MLTEANTSTVRAGHRHRRTDVYLTSTPGVFRVSQSPWRDDVVREGHQRGRRDVDEKTNVFGSAAGTTASAGRQQGGEMTGEGTTAPRRSFAKDRSGARGDDRSTSRIAEAESVVPHWRSPNGDVQHVTTTRAIVLARDRRQVVYVPTRIDTRRCRPEPLGGRRPPGADHPEHREHAHDRRLRVAATTRTCTGDASRRFGLRRAQ